MAKYVIKRVAYGVVTLFVLVSLTFFMQQLLQLLRYSSQYGDDFCNVLPPVLGKRVIGAVDLITQDEIFHRIIPVVRMAFINQLF